MGQNTYWTNFKGSKEEMFATLKGKVKYKGISNKSSKKGNETNKNHNENNKNGEDVKAKYLFDSIKKGVKVKRDDLKQTLLIMKDGGLKDELTFALIRIDELREQLSSKDLSEYIKEKTKLKLKYLEKAKNKKVFYREMAKLVRRYYFL